MKYKMLNFGFYSCSWQKLDSKEKMPNYGSDSTPAPVVDHLCNEAHKTVL